MDLFLSHWRKNDLEHKFNIVADEGGRSRVQYTGQSLDEGYNPNRYALNIVAEVSKILKLLVGFDRLTSA